MAAADLADSQVETNGVVTKNGKPVGVMVEDKPVVGYNTPSRKLELFSRTMADWKWPEFTLPEYYRSHIHRSAQAASIGQPAEDFDPKYTAVVDWPKDAHGDVYTLLPIFRLPESDSHPFRQCEIPLRNFAQESAVGESRRRQETGRCAHRRPDESSHRDRILRAARLGHGGPDARRGRLLASSRAAGASTKRIRWSACRALGSI